MTTCGSCGFSFEGRAVTCPRCQATLEPPPTPLPGVVLRSEGSAGLSGRQRLLVAGGVVATFLLLGLAVFYLAVILYFCLDFTGTGECQDEKAASDRFLFVGTLVVIVVTAAVGWLLARALRRRNLARPL